MGASRRVLVVGGGIGGMASAAAFGQRGMDVLLIEKRPEFTVPGVGLGQPANALRVLGELGVLPQVIAAGFQYDSMRYFDYNRELIVEHKFLLGGPGLPAVCALSRSDLHDILLDAALKVGVGIGLGTTAQQMEQEGNRVHVVFNNGSSDEFDLVVGFDGIRSTTRIFAFGEAFEPIHSGYGAWRLQAPRPPEVDAMEFYQGLGSKTGAMPLNDELMYLFHIRPEDPSEKLAREDYPRYLRERLNGYGDHIAEVRDALGPDSDIVYSPLEPAILPPPWYSGRIVLGGDAAHTFPPHLTEGAGMALEDGLVLADELSQDKPVEDMLDGYVQRRYARCAFVYTFSMQMLHSEQMVRTHQQLDEARRELKANGSARIAASDRILNLPVLPAKGALLWR
ncbi:FAD-dependent monooxygenase [Saxibacter everestensis]|uniref:FAD-dependent monooxygenase n=1 Tax=Saxibacter everestensis TaxID=2909229 RepID=A0ABY8QTD2_9MICO|nr:FAD-dependent monooxygenase [Brevibacteriaceae bacterium ZFBP1038]